jgi:hypothetical protein
VDTAAKQLAGNHSRLHALLVPCNMRDNLVAAKGCTRQSGVQQLVVHGTGEVNVVLDVLAALRR